MVVVFSALLIAGIIAGQVFDFSGVHPVIAYISSICLAFIMIEVGLEFSVDQRKLSQYGWDSLVAFLAAFLPAVLWYLYFVYFADMPWKPSLLAGASAAPTSAGILFSMMIAAGLQTTWVFQKARVLAVLDDLATILLLFPLQLVLHGFEGRSLVVLIVIGFFIFVSFRWQNSIRWPTAKIWLLVYSVLLTAILLMIKEKANIHIEVLIPAFMLGCLLYSRQGHAIDAHPRKVPLDLFVKGLFMLSVGLLFPRLQLGDIPWMATLGHVVVLTILANLGKAFCLLCYRQEASWKERLALSVAMFPRGEVGAAVLLIALSYGFGGYVNSLAMMALALNLVLTGFFIWLVMRLLKKGPRNDCPHSLSI